ncbi:MAG: NAD(P)H-dependent oxidoreductase subunit E [Gammaproteobacteria bacterium]|jgi:NADH-quinone oxidoreductase subunit E
MLDIAIELPLEITSEIDAWILKFPKQHKKSAIIAALTIVQQYNGGWLSKELLNAVANYLEIPKIAVYEVASFYSMFELKPVGKYKICVCTNVSCMLCGCKEIASHLKNKLNLNFGESSKDFKFTLKEVECLAACDKSPVMQINGKYFENVTIDVIDKILAELK